MTGTEHPVVPALARVFDAAGMVVGAGFVVGDGRVATCAHVVCAAAGGDPEADIGPAGPLSLDFPFAGPQRHTAQVERWWPIQPDGTGDVAILQLEPTLDGLRVPPMYRPEQPWGHRFRVIGFPAAMQDGVWTAGELRAKQGTRWVQLQGDPRAQPIVQGFSGGPVWDDEMHAVVGMTVAADASPDTTTAYLIPIQDVLGVDPSLLPNPYRGLQRFDEQHAEFFYGRDDDVQRLAGALERERLVAIVGRSGTGKSSLLRAGLLPRLRAAGAELIDLRPDAEKSATATIGSPSQPTVVYVDQFEDYVSRDPEAARALLDELVAATGSADVRVVLTLRWEAMNELLTDDTARLFEAGTVSVAPMGRTQLRQAIVEPSQRAPGLFFEDGLVDRILDDAGAEPGQLPLVESLLTQLWAARRGGLLTMAAYQELGGVQGAVTRQAETAMQALSGAVPDERVRRLLTMLARPVDGPEFVRRPAPLDELDADLREVTDALVRSRLLVVDQAPDGSHSVELAHQALIDHWPRLRGWLSEDRDFLAWQQDVDAQAGAWRAVGRDHGALLRGSKLAAAQEWLADRADRVPDPHREFIAASRARQRREVRRWRVAAAALLVLVVVAGLLAAVTIQNNRAISANLTRANAQLLADSSMSEAPLDADTANQLALAAYRADAANPAVRTALAKQYLTTISVDRVFSDLTPAAIEQVRSSFDGSVLLLTHRSGATVVRGLDQRRPETTQLSAKGADAYYLSPDGRWVVATGKDAVHGWDLRGPAKPSRLSSEPAATGVLAAFSPDSARFAFVTAARELAVLDVAAARELPSRTPVRTDGLREVWLAADEDLFIEVRSVMEARAIETRRIGNGQRVRYVFGRVGVLDNGTRIVNCDKAGIFDLRSGRKLPQRPRCGANAINVTADQRHTVESIGRPYGAAEPTIAKLTFGALDGRRFSVNIPPLRFPGDNIFTHIHRSRNMAVERVGEHPPTLLLARHRSVFRVRSDPPALSGMRELLPGGKHLLRMDEDGTVRVVDVRSGQIRGKAAGSSANAAVLPVTTLNGKSVLRAVLPKHGSTVTVHRLSIPHLRELSEISIKRPPGVRRSDFHFEHIGDRMVAIAGQWVGVWNLVSGRQEGKWKRIPGRHRFSGYWAPRARPGHPDEVALLGAAGELVFWSLPKHAPVPRLIRSDTQDIGGDFFNIFDQTGNRYITDDHDRRVHVWDVNSGREIGGAITVPGNTAQLLGFTDEGYLVTSDLKELTFWSTSGQKMNTIGLETPTGAGDKTGEIRLSGGSHFLQEMEAAPPIVLAATADEWFRHLCGIQNRPFTAAELKTLPAGTDTEPPCERK